MDKIKELIAKHQEITDKIMAMAEDAANFDDEKQAEYEALIAEADSIEKQIENLEKAKVAEEKAKALQSKPAKDVGRIVPPDPIDNSVMLPSKPEKIKIPANVRRGTKLQVFSDDTNAYSFGQWVRACNGIQAAIDWCGTNGIPLNVHTESSNTGGGYLVPIQFENDIITLINEYGVFRQNSRVRTMTSDTIVIPRRNGGLTAYAVGEDTAITESTKSWDQVQLVARKWGVLSRISNDLSEDAIINVADDLAFEIGYALATKEDQSGFIGTGTSTYNGITGVNVALKAAAGTPTTTSAGGIIVATGNLMSEATLGDHNKVIAICPDYAMNGARWYCSPYYFAAVMQRLAYAAGGNTTGEIMSGTARSFLGYPVVLSNVFPSTDTNSQVLCLFGRLDLATSFGDRRMITIAFSDSANVGDYNVFERDQIAVRGTERYDINCHDVGDTSTAGPIVGLQALNA